MAGPPLAGINTPPISFDKVLGALTIGSWGDSMLLAIECMMVAQYFRKFPKDRWTVKFTVLALLAVDVISSIGNHAYVYLYTVSNWGNSAFLMRQHWPIIIFLPTTGISAFIVQMFLIARVWKLTHNWLITPLLALAGLASCAGAWSTAIITFMHPVFPANGGVEDRGIVEIPCMIWLIGSAIADTGIALYLVWQLSQAKASQFEETRSLLSRLMAAAIQTASAPAILALATLTAFLVDKTSNICVGLGFCLGRIYALTLLYNLGLRSWHRQSASFATSQSQRQGSHGVEVGLGRMNVPRTTIATIDETVTYNDHADSTRSKIKI